jgi:hypothetical protein
MEIAKELASVRNRERTTEDILADIAEQQRQLKLKDHIFKVIHITSVIEDMLVDRMFQRYDIDLVKIGQVYDYDIGNQIEFVFYNANGEETVKYFGNKYIEPVDKLREAFEKLDRFSTNDICEDFVKHEKSFKVNDELPKKIMDVLLSKELKSIIQYNELQNDLHENNNTTRKMKI